MAIKKKDITNKKNCGTSLINSSMYADAEKKLANSPPSVRSSMNGLSDEKLIHELQVHQIELETQAEELRQSQLALTESRDQYLDLYEFAPLGYLTLTDKALVSQVNLTAAVLLGVDRSKLIHARFRIWIVPGDLENWDRYFTNLLTSENKLTATFLLKRGNGTTFPARLESIRISSISEVQSIRVTISDISDIKKAETELQTRDDQIRLQARMLDAVGDAVIAVDTDHKIIFWNEAATRTYGWQSEEVIGQCPVKVTVPKLSEEDAQNIMTQLDKGKSWSGEYQVRHKDGHEFTVHVTDSPVFNTDKKIIAIIGSSHDISEQKKIDVELRTNKDKLLRAQELLNAITTGTEVIIAAQDLDFRYTFFNQAYKEEITRITGKNLCLGTSMVELFADFPDEQKMAINEWSKVMQGKNVNRVIEFDNPHGEHNKIYHVLHTPLKDVSGKIVGAGEVAYDVTQQVMIEDKLRETKEYLDNLISYANAPIIVWDPEFKITLFNCAFEHLTGWNSSEVLGKPLEMILPKNYLDPAMDLIRKTMNGERWESVEIPILQKSGEIRTILWNSGAIFGSDGKTIVSTIAQGQDITDRKLIEKEHKQRAKAYAKMNVTLEDEIRQRNLSDTSLKNTLSLLNAALESTADGICVIDTKGKITSYNQNFVNMWNIPRGILASERNEIILSHILPQLKSPEEYLANIEDLQSHPARESFDMIEFHDGKIFERYSKPQKIGEHVVGRVWSFRDITDRKHAEEKLVASIAEKEVLLREIHHRVKNNLQLISGLLDVSRIRTTDETANSVLTDMMLKIQTMAQIHTRLYESKQFGKISLMGQIEDQVSALSNIYSHKGHEIDCKINPHEIFLPVDQAIPCALVINEILSNTYKHAFKGRNQGIIEISAFRENDQICIIVQDDGVGLPDNFEIASSKSLGLKLIRTLLQYQLKGKLSFKSGNGTEIRIDFPNINGGVNVKNTHC
jgi:PAS domain S-box-containing protein